MLDRVILGRLAVAGVHNVRRRRKAGSGVLAKAFGEPKADRFEELTDVRRGGESRTAKKLAFNLVTSRFFLKSPSGLKANSVKTPRHAMSVEDLRRHPFDSKGSATLSTPSRGAPLLSFRRRLLLTPEPSSADSSILGPLRIGAPRRDALPPSLLGRPV